MDAAAPVSAVRPSWNPLRVSGTALAPNVLLAAKLIALCLLLTNEQARLPDEPVLPLLGFLDALRAPFPFEIVTKLIFFGAAAALLFNRWVRLAALLLGGVILLAVFSSRLYPGSDKLFCGGFLVLVGLQSRGREPWWLRWQIVLAYLAAAFGRGRGLDWPWGALPPVAAADLLGWAAALAAAALAVGFAAPRLWPLAIWTGVLLHALTLGFADGVLPMFFYAALASYLVFAPWPKRALEVFYDGDCGFCEATRRRFEWFDPDRMYNWKRFQEGGWQNYGMTEAALLEKLHVAADGRVTAGFRAFQTMLLYNPLSYFAAAVLLTLPGVGAFPFRVVVAALGIALFLPPLRPLGEAAYLLIARNRHRLPGDAACKVR